jgi:hypothetical protein
MSRLFGDLKNNDTVNLSRIFNRLEYAQNIIKQRGEATQELLPLLIRTASRAEIFTEPAD